MAYVSTADLKSWLSIESTSHDALLQTCIDSAESYVESMTGRVFDAATTAAHTFDAVRDVGIDGLTLTFGGDACAIVGVTNGDGASISSSAYVTEPRNAAPYYAVRLKGSAGVSWNYTSDPEDAITVTAKWGYSETPPADVAHAVKILAAAMYQQKDNASDADRLVSADGVVIVPSSIPKVAADVIRKYRRIQF